MPDWQLIADSIAATANVATILEFARNMLSSGQPENKIKDDLNKAVDSVFVTTGPTLSEIQSDRESLIADDPIAAAIFEQIDRIQTDMVNTIRDRSLPLEDQRRKFEILGRFYCEHLKDLKSRNNDTLPSFLQKGWNSSKCSDIPGFC